tara:strand:+ start:4055 stop:4384 length:330 start_codon:yes stop_codon:yes gene_type:complete
MCGSINKHQEIKLPEVLLKIKRKDLLFLPRYPNWTQILVVEATQDFNDKSEHVADQNANIICKILPVRVVKVLSYQKHLLGEHVYQGFSGAENFWALMAWIFDIEKLLQ